MPKVLIADDHPLYRSALITVFEHAGRGSDVVEVDCLDDVKNTLASSDDIELLLLDLNMPGAQGFSGVLEVRKQFPSVPMVVVSGDDSAETISQVKQYGVAGFLSKTATQAEIEACVTAVEEGDEWFSAHEEISQTNSFANLLTDLTPQQYRITRMIADGMLNKQIAYELNITEPTVKSHVTAILRKLELRDRKQLIKAASGVIA